MGSGVASHLERGSEEGSQLMIPDEEVRHAIKGMARTLPFGIVPPNKQGRRATSITRVNCNTSLQSGTSEESPDSPCTCLVYALTESDLQRLGNLKM